MREIARNLGYLILHTLNPGANGAADYGVGIQRHVCGGVIASITYLCRTFLTLYVVQALIRDSADFTLHYTVYRENGLRIHNKHPHRNSLEYPHVGCIPKIQGARIYEMSLTE
jgi:hypothetical protein